MSDGEARPGDGMPFQPGTPDQSGLRETIVAAFAQWTEDEFSQKVLVPLLAKIGFRDVRFTGGADEKGIDVLYWETGLPEEAPRFTGVQVKKGDITAKVGGTLSPSVLEPQIRQAFNKPVGPPNQDPYTRISTLVICATGRIVSEARKEIEKGLHGQGRLGAPIRFWDGVTVAGFIERSWLSEFAQLAGIPLPTGPTAVVLQGQWNVLSLGMLLAEAGENDRAVPYLEQALRAASFTLTNVLYGNEHRDVEKMVRAGRVATQYDPEHYNQFFIAGYGEFLLERFDAAEYLVREAIRILEADQSEQVRQGPGFQEKHLQSLGILRAIAHRRDDPDALEKLKQAYIDKYRFLSRELRFTPRALGDWEQAYLEEAESRCA